MRAKRVVFSIIRNGIVNGYPFVESYGSWLNFCDKIIIYDGQSNDGTDIVLHRLAKLVPQIEIRSAPWPKASKGGSAIAEFTDSAFAEVREECETLIYVQADELIHKVLRKRISDYQGNKIVQLSRYVLFWNSFNRVLSEDQPGRLFQGDIPNGIKVGDEVNSVEWKSFRIFPAGKRAKSKGDGLSFDIGTSEFESWPEEIYHYGWCFPVNILQKHISHVRLYSELAHYQRRAHLSQKLLDAQEFDSRIFDLMDPQYIHCAKEFWGEHLNCVQHLLAMKVYDPYVGMQLLKDGVRW